MEQSSNTEGILSVVDDPKEPSGDCYKRNSENPSVDKETRLDRSKDRQDGNDFKSKNSELSVAKFTGSRSPNVGWEITENKTTQTVSETDCAILNTQEEKCASLQSNPGEDVQEPTTMARLSDQLKPEDKFDELDVISTINVVTDDNEKPNEHTASVLVGSKTDQTVVKCLQTLIDQAVDEEFGVESLLSLDTNQKSNEQTKQKETKTSCDRNQQQTASAEQSNLEKLSGPSSQTQVEIQSQERPDVGNASRKSLRSKYKQMKACRNYLDQLLIIIDEVQRMNDYYIDDINNKSKEVEEMENTLTYVNENLSLLYELPSSEILMNDEEGLPCATVNVADYGLTLVGETMALRKTAHHFMDLYNENRLHFLDMSREFLLLPLEDVMGRTQNDKIENVLESSRRLYRRFFLAEKFHSEFEALKSDHKAVNKRVNGFNNLIDMLAEQRDNNYALFQ